MAPTIPKMSLVAQYDDLCRYSTVLTKGIEDEFITFVKGQQMCLQKWNTEEREIERLKQLLSDSEAEKKLLETKLKHVRSLVEIEMKKRIKVEAEKASKERQIALIMEVLLADQNAMNDQTREKLALLNATSMVYKNNFETSPKRLETIDESIGSLLSPSDISFDKTDEDLDADNQPLSYSKTRRSNGKRGSSQNSPAKKRKSRENPNDVEEYTLSATLYPQNAVYPRDDTTSLYPFDVGVTRRSQRCSSDPAPSSQPPTPPRQTCKSDSNQLDDVTPRTAQNADQMYLRTVSESTTMRQFSSSSKLSNRMHAFCTKTVIRPETCFPCGRRIKFYKQALKCQDCRATCHPECKDKVSVPCVPTTHTPTHKGMTGTIADFTPSSPPMIPTLIVHCINEIESRGLEEVGLYRVSGSEREVKEIKEKFFKGKCLPSLGRSDIHAICGTVKEFFRSLRESLITKTLWRDFVNAAEMPAFEDSFRAACLVVDKLPQPNRDTLAFLILHLHRVAESPKCKMPIENLAKVFGPTIVGYSVAEPSDSDMLTETKYQFMVMRLLLNITDDYWRQFTLVESDVFQTIPKTPESRPAPEGNILGPISSSGRGSWSYKSRGVLLGKTPLTPRNSQGGMSKGIKRQFFSSPLLK